MRKNIVALSMLAVSFLCLSPAPAAPGDQREPPVAPYLQAGAPTFDLSIVQFRTRFNLNNPALPIEEFQVVDTGNTTLPLTFAASKINQYLYASTALEKGTGKIKTMQITFLPQAEIEGKNAGRALAVSYMSALLRLFSPALSVEQSEQKVNETLEKGKGARFYQQADGAIRYVVADNGEKGLTFAVEPIKLTLSEP
ncbi:DUF1454 family protein [Affinibrenneria salicis]|uniref:DUF1454 family protein n=1 Tax=Affinibrenneria salicis TaxID=2590031 RepID=A0A5J5FY95_9GAMM|nr:DUF1454 family protein [Affinibrenneria salicis]KAA8998584.1 DUF1454 family protein [Affinibrenneria salicis]